MALNNLMSSPHISFSSHVGMDLVLHSLQTSLMFTVVNGYCSKIDGV